MVQNMKVYLHLQLTGYKLFYHQIKCTNIKVNQKTLTKIIIIITILTIMEMKVVPKIKI